MGDTQKERPAGGALSPATLIVTQAQFFDFIEVDFDLAAARIGVDCLEGIAGEVSTEQVPRREGQPGNSDNHHASGQRAVGPHATQEDVGSIDRDRTGTAPDAQAGTALSQVLGKLGEQPIHPTGRAEDTGATLTRRATTRRKIDALVTAQAPQGKVALRSERAQQRAAQNPAVSQTWRTGAGKRNCWAKTPTKVGIERPLT